VQIEDKLIKYFLPNRRPELYREIGKPMRLKQVA
jgi:hypothetical protein